MAGRLAIDFGNAYTVAAYWRQASQQAETIYLPGVTRLLPGCALGNDKGIYAAPSAIAYDTATEQCFIGQEAVEGSFTKLFHDLQFAVVTGKLVNYLTGRQLLSNQDIAKDYVAAILSRSGQVLGLGGEAVVAFTVPMAACRSPQAWRRYRQWLEAAGRQGGFNRLELIEQPWAAAWGAGMRVKPEDRYMVLTISDEYLEAAMVQAINQEDEDSNCRHIRVVSYSSGWVTEADTAVQLPQVLSATVRQVLREAELLGYTIASLAGVVVTGSAVNPALLPTIHELFAGVTIYDRAPLAAAAYGAAILSAGIDGCGYLRHSYAVRYLAEDGYHYREVVPQGMFYPSDGPIAELTIKASYDGQQQFALLLYRMKAQCINEDSPLVLMSGAPAVRGQQVMTIELSLGAAGQLQATARELMNGNVIAESIVAAKLV